MELTEACTAGKIFVMQVLGICFLLLRGMGRERNKMTQVGRRWTKRMKRRKRGRSLGERIVGKRVESGTQKSSKEDG